MCNNANTAITVGPVLKTVTDLVYCKIIRVSMRNISHISANGTKHDQHIFAKIDI